MNMTLKQLVCLLRARGVIAGIAAVSFWERGIHHPRLQHALALGQILGIPVEELSAENIRKHRKKKSNAVDE